MAAIQNSQRSIMNYSDKIELTPSGYWGNSVDNIHIFEDLLPTDNLAELLRYAKCNDDWSAVYGHHQWSDRVHRDFTESIAKQIYENLYIKTKNILQTAFDVSVDSAGFQLNRWRVGDGQSPHADKQELDGSTNCCPTYDLSSVFYLNDDFEGGEIFFPIQSFIAKPVRNMLIMFPGDINFIHGVNTVTKRIRYTVSTFWTVKEIRSVL